MRESALPQPEGSYKFGAVVAADWLADGPAGTCWETCEGVAVAAGSLADEPEGTCWETCEGVATTLVGTRVSALATLRLALKLR